MRDMAAEFGRRVKRVVDAIPNAILTPRTQTELSLLQADWTLLANEIERVHRLVEALESRTADLRCCADHLRVALLNLASVAERASALPTVNGQETR